MTSASSVAVTIIGLLVSILIISAIFYYFPRPIEDPQEPQDIYHRYPAGPRRPQHDHFRAVNYDVRASLEQGPGPVVRDGDAESSISPRTTPVVRGGEDGRMGEALEAVIQSIDDTVERIEGVEGSSSEVGKV
ncbi:hypothetical protein N0V94_006710 [Neodidymelliopsis sp. IMI 364377]|nr:hypothetical protein N0V94_006710 [Neodidymelliopsis sp. IMI 364377]